MLKRCCLLPFVIFLGLTGFAQKQDEVRLFEPDKIVEREIAGGQTHTYQITIAAGQFLRVEVEEKGIEVALTLSAPDGEQVAEADFARPFKASASVACGSAAAPRPPCPEWLSYVAAASGAYRLTIHALGSDMLAGAYRLRVEALRAATEGDRKQITYRLAHRLLVEADVMSPHLQSIAPAEEMIEKLQLALGLWRELRDRVWEAYALRQLGILHGLLSRYEQALEYIEQSLAIWRGMKARTSEGDTLNALGAIYYRQSNYEKASEYYEQALAIGQEEKYRHLEIGALNNLANIHLALGRYGKAIEYFELALATSRDIEPGFRVRHGNILINLGIAYYRLGRYDKAIEYFEQGLAIKMEVKDRAGEGRALQNLGAAYDGLRRREKAIERYEQALAINREEKDRFSEGSTLAKLGDTYSGLARYGEAIERYEQALAISREVKHRWDEGVALNGLGGAHGNLNRYDRAIEYHEQALAIAREIKSPDSEGAALYGLAKAERGRGNLSQARSLIEECLKISEFLRASIYNQELRASYFASVRSYYEFYIDLLMRLHRADPTKNFDEQAIEASERGRARGLLELLTEAGAGLRQGVDAGLIERERTLARSLNAKAQQLTQRNAPDETVALNASAESGPFLLTPRRNTPDEAAALKREISQLENALEQAHAAIRKASPRYAALTQPQPLKLGEIQQQLDADTLLLEYSLGEERSFLWAVTNNSLTSYELPKEQQITQAAKEVCNLLIARSRPRKVETPAQRLARIAQAETQLPQAARRLSQMLLGPAAAQLGDKRLVIVADGALQYLPFAMLPNPNKTTPEPLIVNHEISALPSASTLAVQRRELAGRQPAPKMIAMLADPVFAASDVRLKTVSAQTAAKSDVPAQTPVTSLENTRIIEHLGEASAAGTRLAIPRLPFTRQESKQILALSPKTDTLKATDFKASRATATSAELSQYRYLHFATHGLLDSERPGLSALVLSLVDEQGKAQDGFLRAHEIYNLNLPAELVMLSACQTGLGKEIKGEGLVGLTRGFMYAGAARVVVSLWSVNDRATAELMAKFYRKMLKENQRPAAALRSAQVEMWRSSQWQSPYFWAAFVLQGEWK